MIVSPSRHKRSEPITSVRLLIEWLVDLGNLLLQQLCWHSMAFRRSNSKEIPSWICLRLKGRRAPFWASRSWAAERDEAFLKIRGEQVYLWRAVDEHGQVLDILVQEHRDAEAAERFFRRLLKHTCEPPERMSTDKLASYAAVFPNSPQWSTRRCTPVPG
jgi:transposase-like protein